MPEIFSLTTDNDIQSPNTSWASARGASTGTLGNASGQFEDNGAAVYKFASRGGGSTFRVHRSFYHFDTSGITGTLSEASLHFFSNNATGDANIIIIKSDAFTGGGGALATGDINNLDFSTVYTGETTVGGGATTYTLNATALADIKNNNDFKFAAINYEYDYLNVEPSAATTKVRLYYSDYSSDNIRPHIDYTLATGYSHDIMGLAAANIGKVNSLATAGVSKISGT